MKTKIHFGGIDGLRTIACFGIIAMHIRENTDYQLSSFFYDEVITSWTQFVYLFLTISGFVLSLGYYEKFKENKVNLNKFFGSRYKKILPFFSLMILVELLYNRNIQSLIEGAMESTLIFGLLPNNNFEVIGVGWFLGVIFVFYFLYPFFVFLLDNKRRAWIVLFISLIINYLCQYYFFTDKFVVSDFTPRHTFIFCTPFLISGGLIYLYLNDIIKWGRRFHFLLLISSIVITILYYIIPDKVFGIDIFVLKILSFSVNWLLYVLSGKSKVMDNSVMSYFSRISMEMYLAHMVVFRIVEKTFGLYVFGDNVFSYICTLILTIVLLLMFIEIYKRVSKWAGDKIRGGVIESFIKL